MTRPRTAEERRSVLKSAAFTSLFHLSDEYAQDARLDHSRMPLLNQPTSRTARSSLAHQSESVTSSDSAFSDDESESEEKAGSDVDEEDDADEVADLQKRGLDVRRASTDTRSSGITEIDLIRGSYELPLERLLAQLPPLGPPSRPPPVVVRTTLAVPSSSHGEDDAMPSGNRSGSVDSGYGDELAGKSDKKDGSGNRTTYSDLRRFSDSGVAARSLAALQFEAAFREKVEYVSFIVVCSVCRDAGSFRIAR